MGLLRDPVRNQEAQAHVDHIRHEMLDCMAFFLGEQDARPSVWSRVQYADDFQSLWYLRNDLMQLLSHYCGEALAATKVHNITALFRGHIPAAQFASARRRR